MIYKHWQTQLPISAYGFEMKCTRKTGVVVKCPHTVDHTSYTVYSKGILWHYNRHYGRTFMGTFSTKRCIIQSQISNVAMPFCLRWRHI